ncbi:hypothetical protein StoSoilB13_31370 (plasmid) [Arthrobacter sp. StoSoilB13]|nr:hypothetical protein StoSoilB13_31370 [Arthrobacter sp. StoSoilB13]
MVWIGRERCLSHGNAGTSAHRYIQSLEESHGSTLPSDRGPEPGFGHSISHSHRRNKRRFDPNIQKKRYWVPSLRRNVTLTLSARGIKTIDVRGIDSVVADILARGVKL